MTDGTRRVAELRERIAEVDRALLEQLEARARLSKEVHQLLEIDTPPAEVAERDWLHGLEAMASGDLPGESLRAIFRRIRAEARAIEQPLRVVYVGAEGGFAYEMARGTFGVRAALTEAGSFAEAMDEVARGRAISAVFPFESSVDGLVQPAITALAQSPLVLVAERPLRAVYSLMDGGGEQPLVETLYATATAHADCERFIRQKYPTAKLIDVRSAAQAAELTRRTENSAAIVPESYGQEIGLRLVKSNIGDSPELWLRFGVASARPASRTGNDTTCLLFSVDDKPGALFDVLRHFAERGINLRKLQSRPVNGEGWDYVFYVEVTGHVTDRPVVTALEGVKRTTKYLKVLGSFPSDDA